MTTDRVIFRSPGTQFTAPWNGHWPPPDLLYVVEAKEGLTIVDPAKQSTGVIFKLITQHGATLFEQVSASEIPTPAKAHESWFRGALYEAKEVR